jgi:hypothetical protein
VCAEPLDDVVRRHRLPPPQAIRIAVRSGADEVLRGATAVLEAHRPRSILVMLKDGGEAAAVQAAAEPLGYGATPAAEGATGQGVNLILVPVSSQPRTSRWDSLRRAAGRVRAGR